MWNCCYRSVSMFGANWPKDSGSDVGLLSFRYNVLSPTNWPKDFGSDSSWFVVQIQCLEHHQLAKRFWQ